MAVTQIIGPRIVPLWADPVEWTSTRAYEPFTFVTYQGDSYCSRQDTPIGIDITNDYYWVKVSDYNAQAVALQRSMTQTIETAETNLDTVATNLKNEMQRLHATYQNLESMQADTTITAGTVATILGRSTTTDYGGATYIVAEGSPANMLDVKINDTLYGAFVYQGYTTPEMYGYDGTNGNALMEAFLRLPVTVLDLHGTELVDSGNSNGTAYPCDKTIRNGKIVAKGYLLSPMILGSDTTVTLENLDIDCQPFANSVFSLTINSDVKRYIVCNCHVYSSACKDGWCPFYVGARNMLFDSCVIDASSLEPSWAGGCIWAYSNSQLEYGTLEIRNCTLITNGVDELLALRAGLYKYTNVHDNTFVAITMGSRNFLITDHNSSQTTKTYTHFHDNLTIVQGESRGTEANALFRITDTVGTVICDKNTWNTNLFVHIYSIEATVRIANDYAADCTGWLVQLNSGTAYIYNCTAPSAGLFSMNQVNFYVYNSYIGYVSGYANNAYLHNCTLHIPSQGNLYNCVIEKPNDKDVAINLNLQTGLWNYNNVTFTAPITIQLKPNGDTPFTFITDAEIHTATGTEYELVKSSDRALQILKPDKGEYHILNANSMYTARADNRG